MADYEVEGEKWGGAFGSAGGTVTWAAASSLPSALVASISAAFADWASYANISFRQVASTASAQIVLSEAPIDGPNNVLGETSYSYYGTAFSSASIVFDSGEGWHSSGGGVVSASGVNFFVVALHEIGHSIGLDHYNDAPAVMNAYVSPGITDLASSDIHAVQAIYGARPGSVADSSNAFGTTIHRATSIGGELYELGHGLLGRAPGTLELEAWVNPIQHGGTVQAFTQSLLGSDEYRAAHGDFTAGSNDAFVQGLYQTVLHRAADAGGLAGWVDALVHGTSRVDAALGFVLSDEHVAQTQAALNAGIFVPDPNAADVARLYDGMLGRAPDLAGLQSWTAALAGGHSAVEVADAFLHSAEGTARLASLDDAHFVDAVYQGALGRAADPGGLAGWERALTTTSRATVAAAISESPEAHQHHLADIELGWHTV